VKPSWKILGSIAPALAVALVAPDASAGPIGEACHQSYPDLDLCVLCVVQACTVSGAPLDVCVFQNGPDCLEPGSNSGVETVPDFGLETLPDIDFGTTALLAIASTAGGYVIYQHGGKIFASILEARGGLRFGLGSVAALIGLPILIGDASGQAFNDYVEHYAPCVNPVWNGNEYVCLGNSVIGSTAPGSPGSECPPGTQSQTGLYGTACVPSAAVVHPPTPACASLLTCEQRQLAGEDLDGCGTPPIDVPMACIDASGATTSTLACGLTCKSVDALEPLDPL
jgi:hypothetical protein